VLGAALAQRLARLGIEVTLVEQHPRGDARSASHACTRILRLAHGADVDETRSAWLARSLWVELERETATTLFHEVGMAWLVAAGDGSWEGAGHDVLVAEGIEVERVDPAAIEHLLPGLSYGNLDHVLLEPQAGLLRADAAVEALVDDAVAAGAELVAGRAEQDGPAIVVDGRRIEADRVVWACGAWMPRLFSELVRGAVIQQDVCYFGVAEDWVSPPVPAWGERRLATTGSGDLGGFGFKVGLDAEGPPLDPELSHRTPVATQLAQSRAFLAMRFPSLEAAPLLRTEMCQTVVLESGLVEAAAMLGGEVRLVRHPEHADVWLLGDGSGHAFKHAPAVAVETARILGV
jgi:glycine/D-amino acid oxidase-like deaminating enzyme